MTRSFLAWDQAENRRHAQKAVITWLLSQSGSSKEEDG